MNKLVIAQEIKNVDDYSINKLKIPSLVLMERAAYSVFEVLKEKELLSFNKRPKILILCGMGNNGADGVALARIIACDELPSEVNIMLIGDVETASDEMLSQLEMARNIGLSFVDCDDNINAVRGYDIIIDGIFGIGLKRDIEGIQRKIIENVNAVDAFKVAIDIPSGLCADTGAIRGVALKCDITVTFGPVKAGLTVYNGLTITDATMCSLIGHPLPAFYENDYVKDKQRNDAYQELAFVTEADMQNIPIRKRYSNKGDFGKILVVAGSNKVYGAAHLCAKAAYKTGAGLVKVLSDKENKLAIEQTIPEALIETYDSEKLLSLSGSLKELEESIKDNIAWADIVSVGSGIGTGKISDFIFRNVLKYARQFNKQLIIDADGINLMAEDDTLLMGLKSLEKPAILTPHLKEMERISGKKIEEIRNNLFGSVEEFVRKYGVICVLKDASTLISKKGFTAVSLRGNSSMAKGGSGDVLAGIIAGMNALMPDSFYATALAVFIHGYAGELASRRRGMHSSLASDIVDNIENVIMLNIAGRTDEEFKENLAGQIDYINNQIVDIMKSLGLEE